MSIEELLKRLIRYKTIYPNFDEFNKCISYIKKYLSNTDLYIKEFCYNSDKSILISNTKSKNLDVLFVGHIDVVNADEDSFNPKVIDNKIYGRGSFDMKGHVCVMINLLKYNSFKNKVGLLLTTDEERGGFNGTGKFINKLNYTCKIAIVPDAGNDFKIIEEEKGVLQLKISYIGKESHSSQVWNGDNAIEKIFGLYESLIKKYPLPISSEDYKTSINISKIEGGSSINMVAKECYAIFDIRHVVNDKKEDIINFIKEYNSKFKVDILAMGEPFQTFIDNIFYKKFEESYKKVLNKKVEYSRCESASDGRFFYSKKIPCILMNARGDNIHSKNEYVEIDSLNILYNIYLDYLRRLEIK